MSQSTINIIKRVDGSILEHIFVKIWCKMTDLFLFFIGGELCYIENSPLCLMDLSNIDENDWAEHWHYGPNVSMWKFVTKHYGKKKVG